MPVDLLVGVLETRFQLQKSPIDLQEPAVNLQQPALNLLKTAVNSLEPAVNLLKSGVQVFLQAPKFTEEHRGIRCLCVRRRFQCDARFDIRHAAPLCDDNATSQRAATRSHRRSCRSLLLRPRLLEPRSLKRLCLRLNLWKVLALQ